MVDPKSKSGVLTEGKGSFDTETCREEGDVKMEAEIGVVPL